MASIYKRNNSYVVIYYYTDEKGIRKQKWESYKTLENAQQRRLEIENPFLFSRAPMSINTVNDLMQHFFALYGTTHWSYSTAENYDSLRRRFITPFIGTMSVTEFSGLHVSAFYQALVKGRKLNSPVCKSTVRDLNKLLKSAFRQAVIWGVLDRSPMEKISIPKEKRQRKPAWNSAQVRQAVFACNNDRNLSIAIQFAFACSLRIGELLALKWSDIDFVQKTVSVNKTMQRISRKSLSFIGEKDILEILPFGRETNQTLLVIKSPKTEASMRTVFLPDRLAAQLQCHKYKTSGEINSFVFHSQDGKPIQPECLRKKFRTLVQKSGLPNVTFHSLRHSSVTYKLMLTHGDIKAVQGDTGHAQANMVLEIYAEILDEQRRKTAILMNKNWYNASR